MTDSGAGGTAALGAVDPPYTGGRLTLFPGGLYVGKWCDTVAPVVEIPDFSDPSLCADDMFHTDEVRLRLSSRSVEEEFHDAIGELIASDASTAADYDSEAPDNEASHTDDEHHTNEDDGGHSAPSDEGDTQ